MDAAYYHLRKCKIKNFNGVGRTPNWIRKMLRFAKPPLLKGRGVYLNLVLLRAYTFTWAQFHRAA